MDKDSGFNNLRNDMIEELEEMDSRSNYGGSSLGNFLSSFNPLWIVVVLAGIITIVLIIIFGRGSDESIKRQISELNDRISRIEQRLSAIEELDGRITDIDHRIKAINLSLQQVQSNIKRLSKISSTSRRSKPSKRYYIVKKGDTLFSIARKNNISVSELLRINNLKKGQSIYPGQKLYLTK